MKSVLMLMVLYVFRCEGAVRTLTEDENELGEGLRINNRPIIGVLAQEQSRHLSTKFPDENYTSYIAASYVKAIEAAGARVVPVMIGKDRMYYEELMSKLNGVLFPGGGTYFNEPNGYADAGQHIYDIAVELNEAGDYFPIFGTCLGFELIIILASGRGEPENRVKCYSYENLPLELADDYRDSKMFKETPPEIVDILEHENVSVNAHEFCVLDKNMQAFNLTKEWRVTSHGYDSYGVRFIASVEHKKYPIYGVQFHPEKNAFEWKASKNYPSTKNAIKSSRYFTDFFIDECRKSQHSFASAAEENQYLIYNYPPTFTGLVGSSFQQAYFFEPRGTLLS